MHPSADAFKAVHQRIALIMYVMRSSYNVLYNMSLLEISLCSSTSKNNPTGDIFKRKIAFEIQTPKYVYLGNYLPDKYMYIKSGLVQRKCAFYVQYI